MTQKDKLCTRQAASPPVKYQLIDLFMTLGPGFTRWAESHMAEPGFTPQRIRLMGLLYERGPLKMCCLRNELGVTATNITALVDALEKDNMVARKAHVSDRRATMIELTDKAKTRLFANCTTFKDQVSALFADFSSVEQTQLLTLLNKTREALVQRGILEKRDEDVMETEG